MTLRIRREQMAIFESDMRRRIKEQALDELLGAPHEGLALPDEKALRELLSRSEQLIDGYDGTFRDDAHRYVLLMLAFGEEFQAEEWAAQVFADPDIPGTSKLDVLEAYAKTRPRRVSAAEDGRDGP